VSAYRTEDPSAAPLPPTGSLLDAHFPTLKFTLGESFCSLAPSLVFCQFHFSDLKVKITLNKGDGTPTFPSATPIARIFLWCGGSRRSTTDAMCCASFPPFGLYASFRVNICYLCFPDLLAPVNLPCHLFLHRFFPQPPYFHKWVLRLF